MTDDPDSATARAPTTDEASLRDALADEAAGARRDAALGLRARAEADDLAPATVDRLATVATTDPDPDARQFAVEALGVAGAGADPVTAALADGDEWVRAEAVVAAVRAGVDPSELRPVATDDEAGPVRRNACIALAKAGAATFDLLADRLKHDPHPPVREYAAGFLPEVVDEGDGEETADPPDAVREDETPVEAAERLLAAVLARDPEAHVRARAAAGLGTLGTDRATTALEEHGVDDRSDEVVRAAERALARARGEDPEAVDAGRGPRQGPGTGRGPDAGRPPHGPGADRAGSGPNRPPRR